MLGTGTLVQHHGPDKESTGLWLRDSYAGNTTVLAPRRFLWENANGVSAAYLLWDNTSNKNPQIISVCKKIKAALQGDFRNHGI